MPASCDVDLMHSDADRNVLNGIYRVAHERFGGGASRSDVFDLPLKLNLLRAALRLAPSVWDDQAISHIMYGGDRGNASAKFSRIKYGDARLDEFGASMLAALINYIVLKSPECNEQVTLEQRGEILHWVLGFDGTGGPWLTANDVTGDALQFVSALMLAADAHEYRLRDAQTLFDSQDCIIEYLKAPIDMAERDQRLVIQRPRTRGTTGVRFGAAQVPGAHPRQWPPLELKAGDVVEIGIPRRTREPSTGWLLTVRNAVPPSAAAEVPATGWVWKEGWANTVRWLPRFPLPADTAIMAPPADGHTIVAMPGLYQVFLFVEPAESTFMTKRLLDPSGPPPLDVPCDAGYLRLAGTLLAALVNKRTSPLAGTGIKVYTSSYAVTE
jgi:hypothetical protein